MVRSDLDFYFCWLVRKCRSDHLCENEDLITVVTSTMSINRPCDRAYILKCSSFELHNPLPCCLFLSTLHFIFSTFFCISVHNRLMMYLTMQHESNCLRSARNTRQSFFFLWTIGNLGSVYSSWIFFNPWTFFVFVQIYLISQTVFFWINMIIFQIHESFWICKHIWTLVIFHELLSILCICEHFVDYANLFESINNFWITNMLSNWNIIFIEL